jgi:hypothetical protein
MGFNRVKLNRGLTKSKPVEPKTKEEELQEIMGGSLVRENNRTSADVHLKGALK